MSEKTGTELQQAAEEAAWRETAAHRMLRLHVQDAHEREEARLASLSDDARRKADEALLAMIEHLQAAFKAS